MNLLPLNFIPFDEELYESDAGIIKSPFICMSRAEVFVKTVFKAPFSFQTPVREDTQPVQPPVIVTFPSNIVSPKTYSLLEGEAVPMPMLPDGSLKTAEEVREPDV